MKIHRCAKLTSVSALVFTGVVAAVVGVPSTGNAATQPEAMARDFNVTAQQATKIMQVQDRSIASVRSVAAASGLDERSFAIGDDGHLTASVTRSDAAAQKELGRLAVRTRVVSRSVEQVDAVERAVRAVVGSRVDRGLHHWSAQPTEGTVQVRATQAFWQSAQGRQIARTGGVQAITEDPALAPRPAVSIVGGWRMGLSAGGYCTAGLANRAGAMYSVGHCTHINGQWQSMYNGGGEYIGKGNSSLYKNNGFDIGRVALASGATMPGYVAKYAGDGYTSVVGRVSPTAGMYMCKFGTTTGYTCGRILNPSTTVNYSGTLLYSIFTANTCVEGGDSGGPAMNGAAERNYAVGLTSGENNPGSCSKNSGVNSAGGETSFYSNIWRAVDFYGSELKTS